MVFLFAVFQPYSLDDRQDNARQDEIIPIGFQPYKCVCYAAEKHL